MYSGAYVYLVLVLRVRVSGVYYMYIRFKRTCIVYV